MKKNAVKFVALILLLSLFAGLLCACNFTATRPTTSSKTEQPQINTQEQGTSPDTIPSTATETAEKNPLTELSKETDVPQGSALTIYFMDVGQADAALLCCDSEFILIDGGNTADSSFVYSFLKQHNADHLKYIICTHPHEDHVGGLAGALNYATVEHALCSSQSYDSKAFRSFVK